MQKIVSRYRLWFSRYRHEKGGPTKKNCPRLLTSKIAFSIFTLIFMVSKLKDLPRFQMKNITREEGYFQHQVVPGVKINDANIFA
jgi:hypothetical protein